MSGAVSGIISIAALLVGAAIIATLVKNPQGSIGLVNATTSGFANLLNVAQGNGVGIGNIGQSFG